MHRAGGLRNVNTRAMSDRTAPNNSQEPAAVASNAAAINTLKHSILDSSFPVLLPEEKALFMSEDEFDAFYNLKIGKNGPPDLKELKDEIDVINANTSKDTKPVSVSLKRPASANVDHDRPQKAPFVAALEQSHIHHRTEDDLARDNKATTSNEDVTNISSRNALVDLFHDLSEHTRSDKLKSLLEGAWKIDPLLTLKVIFNARSIHLGKSNKVASYKAFGWLAENHAVTFLANIQWLVRPVIPKTTSKPAAIEQMTTVDGDKDAKVQGQDDDEDFDMVDADQADPTKAHDVRYGVSHGYWKDLLNLVVFAANDQLKFDGDPASLLNQRADSSQDGKRKREWKPEAAKIVRQQQKVQQNERVQRKLRENPFYRLLHVSVARLFAKQLKEDKALLDSGKASQLKKISLAAKWAPTFGEFHDKHTFIQSSIAEILFPNPALYCPDATNRELYLRHVRELYRKQYASPLRKALHVVERNIAAKTFEKIKYDRVPSLAMNRYIKLFMKKDPDRFKAYVQGIAQGTSRISGATLLPSILISKARALAQPPGNNHKADSFKAIKAAAGIEIYRDVVDGQWNTLVKRVRDAGTLESSIAICDVSGSMHSPVFDDGSCPMDSAIGLSLLIAKITGPPFGGRFITFSAKPTLLSVGDDEVDKRELVEQVGYIESSEWGMNTNFVAVFESLLAIARGGKIEQKDMIRQVFVFSDMQFDYAESNSSQRWTTSYERIKEAYTEAGYEVPRLIFWNLAAHKTDKAITMDDKDTALVSGYSQGMLRAFLESGTFDDEEEIVEEEIESGSDDGMTVLRKSKKWTDPLAIVKKAVSHEAYSMLKVLD